MRDGNMAINRSGLFVNEIWPGGALSSLSSQSFRAPILSIWTRLTLFGYLITLAMTQTIYGFSFMNARWAMLIALLAFSTADLVLAFNHRSFRIYGRKEQNLLIIYLLLTFVTIIYAENWIFSAMRWSSHAAMLAVFMILLPRLITVHQIRFLLFFVKYLLAVMVIISWLFPAPDTVLHSGTLYKGVMGNANTLGHIAFMTAILFFQEFLTAKRLPNRYISGGLAAMAALTVWHSGARSSMMALCLGVFLLFFYYRREMRGLVLAGLLLFSLCMMLFPKLPKEFIRFTVKSSPYKNNEVVNPIHSRIPVWSAAYEGFKERPLVGWGFGADDTISKRWKIKLTALGTVERDAVNDFLFMMEGCGTVGLGAYLLLILLVLRQRPGWGQVAMLQRFRRNHKADSSMMAMNHMHVALFIMPACLLILNQFDNSALSAGNLISVTLWLSAGCAAAVRHEIHGQRQHKALR
jgi:O-antigen ligase